MADSSRKKICRTIKDFEREKRKKKRIEIERMRILEIWKVITKFWATDTWDQLRFHTRSKPEEKKAMKTSMAAESGKEMTFA